MKSSPIPGLVVGAARGKDVRPAADLGADAVVDLADEQAIDAGRGARYVQVGSSAGDASTVSGLVLRNKLLTLVGHSLFATPAEVRRSAYARLAGHANDGKFTLDLEETRLEDISVTWEHLKTEASRKLVVVP